MIKKTLTVLYASLVLAQHARVGNPSSELILRPRDETVPACKPFTITWEPTTPNSVSFVLLGGPTTSTIGTGIANTGSYAWIPSATLRADVESYALHLIDDVTGQWQLSKQFNISKGFECNKATISMGADPFSPTSSALSGFPIGFPNVTITANSPGLSPGAIAGICIGAILGAAGIGVAIFLAYRFGKRKHITHQEDSSVEVAEAKCPNSELGGQPTSELYGAQEVNELHGAPKINEVQGAYRFNDVPDGHMVNEMACPVAELYGTTTQREMRSSQV